MADQTITCPHCQEEIPLTQALTAQVSKHIKADLERDHAQSLKQMEIKLEQEKKRIWAIAQTKAAEKQSKQARDLAEQIKEKNRQLKEAEEEELKLRKRARELDEQARKQKIEMARQLDKEREKLQAEAKKQEAEQQQGKLKEKDKQIEMMKKTIDDLRRQSEQGSMQIQGEVGEDALKDILTTNFPKDVIEDVPTGINGADLIHKVNGAIGPTTATILWESKNTKTFTESWLQKLKQDQETVKAEVCVLVTAVLPKEVENFGLVNGVWVTNAAYAVPLATTLRLHLIEVSKIKHSIQGKDAKMEVLYKYLTGTEFRNRIENIVLSFMQMQSDLEAEKRSFNRSWSKREKQLETVMFSTTGIYGDLQGIIGGALPQIEQLEIDSTQPAQIQSGQGLFE